LLTKRELVSAQIQRELRARALTFNIRLDDVSVTHLAFSDEYRAAVENKQVAQQEAERAKYIVEKAKQEKRKIVIKAEGEAKSAELLGNVSFIACFFLDFFHEGYADRCPCLCCNRTSLRVGM
jgi:prohibitin 2